MKMTHSQIMKIHFNVADYPYDYQLDIWKNENECSFYIRECDEKIPRYFDQFLTIGQTLRWIHSGKPDTNYTWHDIDFFSGADFQKKYVLEMRWEELVDSGVLLPLQLNITFPEKQIN
jgi:hypothetical protein